MNSRRHKCLFYIPFFAALIPLGLLGQFFLSKYSSKKEMPESVAKFRIEHVPILKTKIADSFKNSRNYKKLSTIGVLTDEAEFLQYCRYNEYRHDRILQNNKRLIDKCLLEAKIYGAEPLRSIARHDVLNMVIDGLTVINKEDDYELRLKFVDQELATEIVGLIAEQYQTHVDERTYRLMYDLLSTSTQYQPDVFNIVPTGFTVHITQPPEAVKPKTIGGNSSRFLVSFCSCFAAIAIAYSYAWLFQRFPGYVFGMTFTPILIAIAFALLSRQLPVVYVSQAKFRGQVPPLVVSPNSSAPTINVVAKAADIDNTDTIWLYKGVESTLEKNNLYGLKAFKNYDDPELINEKVLGNISATRDEVDRSIVNVTFKCTNQLDGETVLNNLITQYIEDRHHFFENQVQYQEATNTSSKLPFKQEFEILALATSEEPQFATLVFSLFGGLLGYLISILAVFVHILVSHRNATRQTDSSEHSRTSKNLVHDGALR